MAKSRRVAELIEQRIAEQQLQPGDPLPSERQLARELGVAYGTVRLAYDSLYRLGVIDRQQGRGTFVNNPADAAPAQRHRRLGLLSVDMRGYESPFLRFLTYEIQRLAREAGYELTIDQIDMEDMVAGRMPPMLQRRSVSGFFIYGRVRDFHIRYLDEHPLPYVLVGNRPVPPSTPQVYIDVESLTYQYARALLKQGRSPLWIDVDPSNTSYEVGQEMLRGYTRAQNEAGNGQLHLCNLQMNRLDQAVSQLLTSDLRNAAYIVQDWSSTLLMPLLSGRTRDADQLLLAPMPMSELVDALDGPNVLMWDRAICISDLAAPAVEQLLACVEGRQPRPQSVRFEATCTPQPMGERGGMSLKLRQRVIEPAEHDSQDQQPSTPTGAWMM
ncbi:MAG: GntR family transcriptional regulator [bacterium]